MADQKKDGMKIVEGKSEESKPVPAPQLTDVQKSMQEAVQTAVMVALPAAVQAAAGVMRAGMPAPPKQRPMFENICPICRQPALACGYDAAKVEAGAADTWHRRAVVYPRTFTQGFDGVRINGVHYRSRSANDVIMVPAKSEPEAQVSRWEQLQTVYNTSAQVNENIGRL